MPKGVLDNMAALGDFFRGPFADLMVKLTGPHSLFYQTQLNMLLRMSPEETLDYRLTQLIELGKYNCVNADITSKYFPVANIPKLEGEELFHSDKSIHPADMIFEMIQKGFRPATMAELLVYGAKNPEEQRKYDIIALGSTPRIGRDRYVGVLRGGLSERRLALSQYGSGWGLHTRFLAVRE